MSLLTVYGNLNLKFFFFFFRHLLQGCMHTGSGILHHNGVLSVWTAAKYFKGKGCGTAKAIGCLGKRDSAGHAVFAYTQNNS